VNRIAIVISLAVLLLLPGCVTTPERMAAQKASCEEMERDMGLRTTHDHAAIKNAGENPMNLTHAQCQKILGLTR
jgi:hypothetical protein